MQPSRCVKSTKAGAGGWLAKRPWLAGCFIGALIVKPQVLAVIAVFLIPVVLASRFVSVSLPVGLLRMKRSFSPGTIKIMTWGGLRGGISVALALSLPAGAERDTILLATYVVVVFSIVVQGLSLGPLIRLVERGSENGNSQ